MGVLIVDDSRAMRMIVKRTLRKAGIDTDTDEAENGVQALEKLRGSAYDYVLCDWNMPEMNGIELLRALNDEDIKVKFGFVTSEVTEEMRGIAQDAGARFLIGKPFTPEQFAHHLRGAPAPVAERPTGTGGVGNLVRPTTRALAELLTGLFGRDVAVREVDRPGQAVVAGVVAFDDDSPAYLCAGDLRAVCFLGGALSMVPPGGARDMVAEGGPSPMVRDNFYELLNVSSSAFNTAGSDHVRLLSMHAPTDVPPPHAALFGQKAWHLEVEVHGYGVGQLTYHHA